MSFSNPKVVGSNPAGDKKLFSHQKATVWKFQTFSAIQILREINFCRFRNGHFDSFGASELWFCKILALRICLKFSKIKLQSFQICLNCRFWHFGLMKLISHKIWILGKFITFHTVQYFFRYILFEFLRKSAQMKKFRCTS